MSQWEKKSVLTEIRPPNTAVCCCIFNFWLWHDKKKKKSVTQMYNSSVAPLLFYYIYGLWCVCKLYWDTLDNKDREWGQASLLTVVTESVCVLQLCCVLRSYFRNNTSLVLITGLLVGGAASLLLHKGGICSAMFSLVLPPEAFYLLSPLPPSL